MINYFSNNNITHVYYNDILQNKYYYDNIGQLVRNDDYNNNRTYRYTYDINGNIIWSKEYEINTYNLINQNKYYYANSNWCDLLTKYNNDSILYDEIGNPTSIGNNITLQWELGKYLSNYNDSNLNINVSYEYDYNGYRKKKNVNNTITNYYVENGKIIFEEKNNNIIWYLRNKNEELVGFVYNDNIYYYIKDGKDDIVGIMDSLNQIIAKYKYDEWGNIISITNGLNEDVSSVSSHIANINPFRYKGYYYDEETKLYYLNSRYYNPKWRRFISSDSVLSPDSMNYNMYCYCANNPVNNCDKSGTLFKAIKGFIMGAVSLVTKKLMNKKNSPVKTKTNRVEKQPIISTENIHTGVNFTYGVFTKQEVRTGGNSKSNVIYEQNYSSNPLDCSHSITIKGERAEITSEANLLYSDIIFNNSSDKSIAIGKDGMYATITFTRVLFEDESQNMVIGDFKKISINNALLAVAVIAVMEAAPVVAASAATVITKVGEAGAVIYVGKSLVRAFAN